MRRMLLGIATAIMGMSMLLKMLFGAALHLFTVWIAFKASGVMAAILCFVFPVFAQLYWIVVIWTETGAFLNLYTLACLAYVGLWIVIIFAASIAVASED